MPGPAWSRLVNTTTQEYVTGEEVEILRNRILLAKMQAMGRITFNHGGLFLDWKVRYKRAPMQGYADGDVLTFSRRDRWKTAQLEWRGYSATDSVTKMEMLMNKDVMAIVKYYSQMATVLMEDVDDQFGDEFYIDGNAAGNTKRIHGVESFFANTSTRSASPVGTPDDSYAGLDTDLGAYGGAWSNSNTWPTGTGDAHFDFWSPLIVDYTSALSVANGGWTPTTKTWPNTCREVLNFATIKGQKNKSRKGRLDLGILNDELYRQLQDKIEAAERVNVQANNRKGSAINLGFEAININGLDITFEYGVPAALGYIFPTQLMELKSLQEKLFVVEGPDYDIASKSHRYAIDFMGNLVCKSPRNFVKLAALGGS